MRDFHRERKQTWYILLLESVLVFFTLHTGYEPDGARFFAELIICLLAVALTRFLTVQPTEKCSDFLQGALTIGSGMAVYACYSIETQSDRMLPVCMFFVLAESTMYKNQQLNIFVTAMNVFLSLVTLAFDELGILHRNYSQMEFFFIILFMLIASVLMILMQTKDWFIERVAKEDEKSLDDLLQLVEMKCEDATAAAEAKSSFLANMSHEIRTPINAVLGMNEMILREEQDEEIRGYAQNIQRAGTTLLSLINDILDLSKIESGKMEIVPEKYMLNDLLYDILLVVQPRAEKKGLQLALDIDENIPNELYGDEVRIRQIITNILTNAVKYTEKGSVTLRVKMETKDKRHIILKVAVKDTGIGIRESKEVLFASFQRGGDLKAHHIEGTGLGLSITQQLLQMMDSELEMESAYGKGSTFYFDLPQMVVNDVPMGDLGDLYKKRLDQEQKYRVSFTAPQAHVLVVDDNAMNRTVVQSLLKQTQVQLDAAEDGGKCLEICAKKHYDLILMDHLMPNMDGVETFHALRADREGINYRTPVVILTANAVAGMKQNYLDEGFDGFLSKPVQAQLLEETLMQYLPQELVKLARKEQADDTEEKQRQQIVREAIDRLRLSDMDLDDALQYSSGTVSDVLDNIRGYLTESAENRARIQKEYEDKNWNDFKIHVHALKSTSRVVGAIHMAFLAERMEKAAGGGDVSYIAENFENLMGEYAGLCMDLNRLLAEPKVQELAPAAAEEEQEDSSYLEKVRELLLGVQEYDVDFEQMRAFCNRYPGRQSLKKERMALAKAVEDFDYEAIGQMLQQILDLLETD